MGPVLPNRRLRIANEPSAQTHQRRRRGTNEYHLGPDPALELGSDHSTPPSETSNKSQESLCKAMVKVSIYGEGLNFKRSNVLSEEGTDYTHADTIFERQSSEWDRSDYNSYSDDSSQNQADASRYYDARDTSLDSRLSTPASSRKPMNIDEEFVPKSLTDFVASTEHLLDGELGDLEDESSRTFIGIVDDTGEDADVSHRFSSDHETGARGKKGDTDLGELCNDAASPQASSAEHDEKVGSQENKKISLDIDQVTNSEQSSVFGLAAVDKKYVDQTSKENDVYVHNKNSSSHESNANGSPGLIERNGFYQPSPRSKDFCRNARSLAPIYPDKIPLRAIPFKRSKSFPISCEVDDGTNDVFSRPPKLQYVDLELIVPFLDDRERMSRLCASETKPKSSDIAPTLSYYRGLCENTTVGHDPQKTITATNTDCLGSLHPKSDAKKHDEVLHSINETLIPQLKSENYLTNAKSAGNSAHPLEIKQDRAEGGAGHQGDNKPISHRSPTSNSRPDTEDNHKVKSEKSESERLQLEKLVKLLKWNLSQLLQTSMKLKDDNAALRLERGQLHIKLRNLESAAVISRDTAAENEKLRDIMQSLQDELLGKSTEIEHLNNELSDSLMQEISMASEQELLSKENQRLKNKLSQVQTNQVTGKGKNMRRRLTEDELNIQVSELKAFFESINGVTSDTIAFSEEVSSVGGIQGGGPAGSGGYNSFHEPSKLNGPRTQQPELEGRLRVFNQSDYSFDNMSIEHDRSKNDLGETLTAPVLEHDETDVGQWLGDSSVNESSLEAEVNILKSQVQGELLSLKKSLKEKVRECQNITAIRDELEVELNNAYKDHELTMKESQENADLNNEEIIALKLEIADLREQVDALEQENDQFLRDHEATVDAMGEQLADLVRQNCVLRTKCDDYAVTIENIQSEFASSTQLMSKIIANYAQKVFDLEGENLELAAALEVAKKTAANRLSATVERLTSDLVAIPNESDELKIVELEKKLDDAESHLLEFSRAELIGRDHLRDLCESLQAENYTMKKELFKLRQSADDESTVTVDNELSKEHVDMVVAQLEDSERKDKPKEEQNLDNQSNEETTQIDSIGVESNMNDATKLHNRERESQVVVESDAGEKYTESTNKTSEVLTKDESFTSPKKESPNKNETLPEEKPNKILERDAASNKAKPRRSMLNLVQRRRVPKFQKNGKQSKDGKFFAKLNSIKLP